MYMCVYVYAHVYVCVCTCVYVYMYVFVVLFFCGFFSFLVEWKSKPLSLDRMFELCHLIGTTFIKYYDVNL